MEQSFLYYHVPTSMQDPLIFSDTYPFTFSIHDNPLLEPTSNATSTYGVKEDSGLFHTTLENNIAYFPSLTSTTLFES